MAAKTNWKDIAELVGIAAIVASLIFVGQQMRQDREIAQADAYMQTVDNQIAFGELVNANAALWLGGLQATELSEIDQLKFDQIAMAYEQIHSSQYHRSVAGVRAGSAEAVVREFAASLYVNPGLRESIITSWDRRRAITGRSRTWFSAVEKELARFDHGEVEPPTFRQGAF